MSLALALISGPSDVALGAATLALGLVAGVVLGVRRRGRRTPPSGRVIVALPGEGMSCAAVDSAGRLARADDAVVVPAVLVVTPYHLPLDHPLPESASHALDVLDAVEQRLQRFDVEVDGRLVQGRTPRHALRRLVEQERFDRLVVPAATHDGAGFSADDVAWLLAHVEGEVLVLRPTVGSPPDALRAARPDPLPADPVGGRRRGPAAAGVRP